MTRRLLDEVGHAGGEMPPRAGAGTAVERSPRALVVRSCEGGIKQAAAATDTTVVDSDELGDMTRHQVRRHEEQLRARREHLATGQGGQG